VASDLNSEQQRDFALGLYGSILELISELREEREPDRQSADTEKGESP